MPWQVSYLIAYYNYVKCNRLRRMSSVSNEHVIRLRGHEIEHATGLRGRLGCSRPALEGL